MVRRTNSARCACCMAVAVFLAQNFPHLGADTDHTLAAGSVARRAWSTASLQIAVRERRPTVFEGSPMKMWPATSLWTEAEHFKQKADGALGHVARGSINWNWAPARPLCDDRMSSRSCPACHGDAEFQQPWQNMSVVQFLHALDSGDPLLYYSPVEREFATLSSDIDFDFALSVIRSEEGPRLGESGQSALSEALVYLWLGGNNIATQMHFDLSHNVYAQLRGSKHFVLAPPSVSAAVRLYPRSHPGNQKSQIDWSSGTKRFGDENLAAWNKRGIVDVAELVLKPGELLYLPPLTFHHVRSLAVPKEQLDVPGSALVVSTNLWTYGVEFDTFERLMSLGLPDIFGTDGTVSSADVTQELNSPALRLRTTRVAVLHTFSLLLAELTLPWTSSGTASATSKGSSAAEWIATTLGHGRYEPVIKHYHGCGRHLCALSGTNQCLNLTQKTTWTHSSAQLVREYRLDDYARRAAEVLNDAGCHAPVTDSGNSEPWSNPLQTRRGGCELLLANYLDEVVAYVLGVNDACSFFLSCFVLDQDIQ